MMARIAVSFVVTVLVGGVLIVMGVKFPEGWGILSGVDAGLVMAICAFVALGWMLFGRVEGEL